VVELARLTRSGVHDAETHRRQGIEQNCCLKLRPLFGVTSLDEQYAEAIWRVLHQRLNTLPLH